MYNLSYTGQFKKDLKRLKKQSIGNFKLTQEFIVGELAVKGAMQLDKKYLAHKLTGKFRDNWECHIKPDLLIIWIEITDENEIKLIRLGSHSDLF